jgi:hypothetical protein
MRSRIPETSHVFSVSVVWYDRNFLTHEYSVCFLFKRGSSVKPLKLWLIYPLFHCFCNIKRFVHARGSECLSLRLFTCLQALCTLLMKVTFVLTRESTRSTAKKRHMLLDLSPSSIWFGTFSLSELDSWKRVLTLSSWYQLPAKGTAPKMEQMLITYLVPCKYKGTSKPNMPMPIVRSGR